MKSLLSVWFTAVDEVELKGCDVRRKYSYPCCEAAAAA